MALMSLKRVKHVVVTDDDIDIFDPESMERALAYRVRPTRDIVIVDGARGSHLDPSTQLHVTKGALAPLTAKWGVDATIPEGSDISEYDPIDYPFKASDPAPTQTVATPSNTADLAEAIAALLVKPLHFSSTSSFVTSAINK
jgi:2,5-furandicarboxylate decarboxylase 1